MEIKVNDYVRTKNGIIAKIESKRRNPYGEETIFKLDKKISIYDLKLSNEYLTINPLAEDTTNEIDTHFGDEKIILKSSPKIIDLIEVGDYVNGFKVDALGDGHYLIFYDGDGDWYIDEKEIETIVTKEQFEQMEYKVGE